MFYVRDQYRRNILPRFFLFFSLSLSLVNSQCNFSKIARRTACRFRRGPRRDFNIVSFRMIRRRTCTVFTIFTNVHDNKNDEISYFLLFFLFFFET